ncbi:MAG TPA: hypothetical protein VF602_13110 [Pedobacter sp.]|jgi:hypothetical protein
MKFYLSKYKSNKPPASAKFPCITFYRDTWNDFSYYTQFFVKLWIEPSEPIELETIKILQLEEDKILLKTNLPEEFDRLDTEFCSLGQGKKYYDELINHWC